MRDWQGILVLGMAFHIVCEHLHLGAVGALKNRQNNKPVLDIKIVCKISKLLPPCSQRMKSHLGRVELSLTTLISKSVSNLWPTTILCYLSFHGCFLESSLSSS